MTAPARKLPGKLKKLPESSPEEWQDHVKPLAWSEFSDTTAERTCLGDPNEHSTECNLIITAAEGAVLLGPRDYDATGRVIARIVNIGTRTDSMYGVRAKDTAFVHVMQKNDKRIVARLVTFEGELLEGSKNSTEHGFSRCDHASSDTLQHHSVAKMRFCREMAPPSRVGASQTDTLRTQHNRPAWITCAQGCCVVEEGP